MSWFFPRRKPQSEYSEVVGVVSGLHRSPGLSALSAEFKGRKIESVLDLGASINDNLTYFSQYCSNIVIRDLTDSHQGETERPRASLFQVDLNALEVEEKARYDAILVWDLLHYVERPDRQRFIARLAKLSNPGALVLVMAAGSTAIPLLPVLFKIRDRDSLIYEVRTDRQAPAPHFTPREVEQLMPGFRPVRFFQLRNGLQEFLFQYEAPEKKTVEEEDKREQAKPGNREQAKPGNREQAKPGNREQAKPDNREQAKAAGEAGKEKDPPGPPGDWF